jgi:2-polyprenyl-3-methyl-5-hydroxy-6-metoxy-1,4-benzoquinol methylase/glycosyltransferase involved in cell wall biosynthesis
VDYVIHSMGMPFNGDTLKTRSLGGSESAAYYIARELADRGNRVVMFTNSQDGGDFDGVTYCWNGECTKEAPLGEKFAQYACATPHDVLIIQRHHLAFHKDYASKINVLQLHDLALIRSAGAMNAGACRIDLVTGVSDFHTKQIREIYGFKDSLVRTVPNGIDPDLYYGTNPEKLLKVFSDVAVDGMRYLYQSRPERGLEHLVRPDGIMSKLHSAGSKAHLFVCAYDYTTPETQGFYQYLYDCASQLPNVTIMGALTKVELAQVQMNCDALVYPTEFEEVSCITAMEAMAAGLPFISTHCAALPETCKDSGSILIPMKDGAVDEQAFVDALLKWEGEENEHARAAYEDAQYAAAETRTWKHAVDVLEAEINSVITKRQSSAPRMMRHAIEHSDIGFFDEYETLYIGMDNPLVNTAKREREEMYSFIQSPEALKKHYAKWEGLNCDRMAQVGLDAEVEQASVQKTTRYRGIMHHLGTAIAQKINMGLPVRVLEFGCAHGHITALLAKSFPQAHFVGIDFMDVSIKLARKYAEEQQLANLSYQIGSLDDIKGQYDVIIAAEVIEHIYDYKHALNKLMGHVKPHGHLIVTTPSGRWEWSGRHWWNKGREHLHHFDRQDIISMFREFEKPAFLYAPGGADPVGGQMGSWCYSVKCLPGAVVHEYDLKDKLATYVPRDTVSLCMIVHNAQDSIGASLRSIAPWVDEVVIIMDPKTNDKTWDRIAEVEAELPHVAWTVVEGESPLEIGFDEARNRTIDMSHGDWIFWLDADEEVTDAHNIWRLLRPGAFNAFAISQHHMSQKPAACITTDFPARLFRRDSGARFYGVVHEHPEVEMGKAIPHTQQLHDVTILHYGYTDENARRTRFSRNFPLLMKDIEKHPKRTLNKFLYLRDLSQGIVFEGESTGGVSQRMMDSAHKVVKLFDEMIDENPMLRMTLDAVPYYSTASATLGGGFTAMIRIETKKDELPGMKAAVDIEGRFHNREIYTKLLARIAQETTVNYDAAYI